MGAWWGGVCWKERAWRGSGTPTVPSTEPCGHGAGPAAEDTAWGASVPLSEGLFTPEFCLFWTIKELVN